MATQKLYPPILAGTTPPFYTTNEGTILTVPFSLNKLNVASEIGGVKLRMRDADTDVELIRKDATVFSVSSDNCSATFDITGVQGIVLGKYYKIQLAYIDAEDSANIGYYSSVSIIKCTAYPTVSILGLSAYNTNVDVTYYTGNYININDPSEKCYQYRFLLYDSEYNTLADTGWMIHNSNTDDTKTESNDNYTLEFICDPDSRYRLQYKVTTTNGLVVSSPTYILCGSSSINPLLEATISAELNYDNGCIDVYLVPDDATAIETTAYVGNFVLSRTSSKDDYKTQIQVVTFALTGTLPKGPVFHDCTIEHGYTYRYSLQQYNSHGIYSSRLYSEDVYSAFEDAFLFDGEKQLRIRFNPKIASFKTVLQDSKKNTLGSKYPFFFRNGSVEYKEFTIGGLISYNMDENEFFLSYEDDLDMDKYWDFTTNIIDENIAYERKFKLAVMDWLNDGNIKLFRSPGEGNYLVRLTNIALTPNDSLSRMIHSFTCTADEIADCNAANLLEYGFLHVSENNVLELRFGTINFDKQIESLIGIIQGSSDTENATQEVVNQALEKFASTNLLDGRQCQYLKLDECQPGNTWFNLDGKKYVIGATGAYEVTMPDKSDSFESLQIIKPYRHMPGSVTYGLWTTKSSIFDVVTDIEQSDVFDCPATAHTNYIEDVQNTKSTIKNILFMQFTLKDLIYEITSVEDWMRAYDFYLSQYDSTQPISNARARSLVNFTAVYKITFTKKDNRIDKITGEQQALGTRTYQDLFVDGALFYCPATGYYYEYDQVNEWLYMSPNANPSVTITNSAGEEQTVHLNNSQICIDNEIIDIEERGYFYVPTTSYVPKQIYWGVSVNAVIAYQLLTLVYGVESATEIALGQTETLTNLWSQYSSAARRYQAQRLQYVYITGTTAAKLRALVNQNAANPKTSYYVWNNVTLHFDRLTLEEQATFKGSGVWAPYEYAQYRANPTWQSGTTTSGDFKYKKETCTEGTYQNCKQRYYKALDEVLALEELEVVIG